MRPERGVYGGFHLPLPTAFYSRQDDMVRVTCAIRAQETVIDPQHARQDDEDCGVASLASRELRDLALSHGTRVSHAHSSYPLL